MAKYTVFAVITTAVTIEVEASNSYAAKDQVERMTADEALAANIFTSSPQVEVEDWELVGEDD